MGTGDFQFYGVLLLAPALTILALYALRRRPKTKAIVVAGGVLVALSVAFWLFRSMHVEMAEELSGSTQSGDIGVAVDESDTYAAVVAAPAHERDTAKEAQLQADSALFSDSDDADNAADDAAFEIVADRLADAVAADAQTVAVEEAIAGDAVARAPASEPARERPSLPEYPWPPEQPSSYVRLDQIFPLIRNEPSLFEIHEILSSALYRAEYYVSFYSAPGGFAMVTRLGSNRCFGCSLIGWPPISSGQRSPRLQLRRVCTRSFFRTKRTLPFYCVRRFGRAVHD